jgi:mRNA interferase MazF
LEVAVSRSFRRGDVCLIQLDPTRGSEIRKTRPCLVVSPDELNLHLRTLIVAPMTTGGQAYPWRVTCRFQNRAGFVAIDQLRTVDNERIAKRLGRISSNTLLSVLNVLQEMFSG